MDDIDIFCVYNVKQFLSPKIFNTANFDIVCFIKKVKLIVFGYNRTWLWTKCKIIIKPTLTRLIFEFQNIINDKIVIILSYRVKSVVITYKKNHLNKVGWALKCLLC